MSKIYFDVDVANGIAIDVINDLLPVWWMEVYPFSTLKLSIASCKVVNRYELLNLKGYIFVNQNQSKSLLHAEIKW